MASNFIQELEWRGMVQDITPGLADYINKNKISGYIGFDPTADSLHLGNLLPLIILKHFQKHGHKPFVLVGGATGMIGDPSGKSQERNLLSLETLQYNLECIKKQMTAFLDFSPHCINKAEMVNNYDWFKDMSFLSFIRETGKMISVNYMMAKDSVKKRLESEVGMSFTEFTYQLIQGYDFYHLHQHHNCILQMGGSDQWGNIVTGTELIRKKSTNTMPAFALTCPLLTKTDGSKFGKSESGNIWLDKNKTSPFKMYQFWLNSADEDVTKWLKVFTFKNQEEVNNLLLQHQQNPSQRLIQQAIAKEVIELVHTNEDYLWAVKASNILFGNESIDWIKSLELKQFLELMEGIPEYTLPRDFFNTENLLSILAESKVFNSKGEAKKMIENGGLYINKNKITTIQQDIKDLHLFFNQYLLIQKGKKNYALLHIIS